MRTVAIIQARMGSTRLPGKVLLPLAGKPMLWHVVERVRHASLIDDVVVATSTEPGDDAIREFGAEHGIEVFSGSESDVLDRYYRAAWEYSAEAVVRVTGDCPLVDPNVADAVVDAYAEGGFDHVGATSGSGARAMGSNGFPEGAGASCFGADALRSVWLEATTESDREHVETFMVLNPDRFSLMFLVPHRDLSEHRWTVDRAEDLGFVRAVYDALFVPGKVISGKDVLAYLDDHPEVMNMNRAMLGHEKYKPLWDELDSRGTATRVVDVL